MAHNPKRRATPQQVRKQFEATMKQLAPEAFKSLIGPLDPIPPVPKEPKGPSQTAKRVAPQPLDQSPIADVNASPVNPPRTDPAEPARQPKDPRATGKRGPEKRVRQVVQGKQVKPQQRLRKPRPAGQGKGPPQPVGRPPGSLVVDPDLAMDFDIDNQIDERTATFEELSDQALAFAEGTTVVIERLVHHLAALTTRVRILESVQDRVRMG